MENLSFRGTLEGMIHVDGWMEGRMDGYIDGWIQSSNSLLISLGHSGWGKSSVGSRNLNNQTRPYAKTICFT